MPATAETWMAATTAPGLSPLREDDMTLPAAEAWPSWWRGRQPPDFIAREVVGPHGIADLVAVQFDRPALRARATAGLHALGDLAALRVVLACRRSARPTVDLAEILGLSESGVRRAVHLAYEAGALEDAGDRRHRTNVSWRPVGHRLVAVELKRSDWQRAADQLWAYQGWASSTWLVLGKRPPMSAVKGLYDAGMGLAYLGESTQMQVVLRPKSKRRLSGVASVWASEQALEHALASGFDPRRNSALRRDSAMLRGESAVLAG